MAGDARAEPTSRSRVALAKRRRAETSRTTGSFAGNSAINRTTGSSDTPTAASNSVRDASGRSCFSTPVSPMAVTAGRGSGAASSFISSLDTRSADNRLMPGASLRQAASAAASGSPRPYQAKKRKKRRMRR